MTVMLDERLKNKRDSFIKTLNLVFPNYSIGFTPNSILMKKNKQLVTIDKENFDIFQQVLKDIFCLDTFADEGFHPVGKKSREIAEKLMKAR